MLLRKITMALNIRAVIRHYTDHSHACSKETVKREANILRGLQVHLDDVKPTVHQYRAGDNLCRRCGHQSGGEYCGIGIDMLSEEVDQRLDGSFTS